MITYGVVAFFVLNFHSFAGGTYGVVAFFIFNSHSFHQMGLQNLFCVIKGIKPPSFAYFTQVTDFINFLKFTRRFIFALEIFIYFTWLFSTVMFLSLPLVYHSTDDLIYSLPWAIFRSIVT